MRRADAFLDEVGVAEEEKTFCYPYGAYDKNLLSVLKKHRYRLGVTTEVRMAELDKDARLLLPRRDTNDFPTH